MAQLAEAGILEERYGTARGRVVACADDGLPPAARFFSSRGMRTCSQPFAVELDGGELLLIATRYLELGPMVPEPKSFGSRLDYQLPLGAYANLVFEHRREEAAPSWVGAARGLSAYRGTSTKVTRVAGRTTSLIVLSDDYTPTESNGVEPT